MQFVESGNARSRIGSPGSDELPFLSHRVHDFRKLVASNATRLSDAQFAFLLLCVNFATRRAFGEATQAQYEVIVRFASEHRAEFGIDPGLFKRTAAALDVPATHGEEDRCVYQAFHAVLVRAAAEPALSGDL